MKNFLALAVVALLLSVPLSGCSTAKSTALTNGGTQQAEASPGQSAESDGKTAANEQQIDKDKSAQDNANAEKAVKQLVEDFGKKLQMVSLLAPKETLSKSMKDNYGDYVSPDLLTKWVNDPEHAPGRLTSSPWPDRIEVQTVKQAQENTYQVQGEIIEITSVEQANGGVAAKRKATFDVKRFGYRWLIDAVTLGDEEALDVVVYDNSQYGFRFKLPASWKGYSIVMNQWEGLTLGDAQGEKVTERGPMIAIRHPQWTSDNPRQDIPIMVFTTAQWNSLQKDKFHIGAAPINPSELGRNAKYVFALPARYNYAFPTGYKEVEDILNKHSLQPYDADSKG